MITRHNILTGAAAAVASKAAVPWVGAPGIVRATSLMAVRGTPLSVERIYYGYIDRLAINNSYVTGKLRGPGLLRVINDGVLRHVPPARLAYDLARWGTAPLSLSERQERAAFFGYGPILPERPLYEVRS